MRYRSLPDDFKPLCAVVSDFHLGTKIERACESFLKLRGLRKDILSRNWNWMIQPERNILMANELLSRLHNWTNHLISLGDHYSHLVNEHGLSEMRARISALEVIDIIYEYNWQEILWVPSDHDLGTPHETTSGKVRKHLESAYAQFEETE